MSIKVAPCSHEAARFAVMTWHYSRKMPISKLVTHGVWENDKFIGAVIYGRGANHHLGKPYGLDQTECCELVRVALNKHDAPVSQIVAESLKLLKQTNPGLRLVVSYADPEQNHRGGIYQAGNWLYTGQSTEDVQYFYEGKWYHSRMLGKSGFGTHTPLSRLSKEQQKQLKTRKIQGKHRYIMPLDKAMRRRVAVLGLPYPHAVEESKVTRGDSVSEMQVRPLPTALIEQGAHG